MTTCSYIGSYGACERLARAHGLCEAHAAKRRAGSTLHDIQDRSRICRADGCAERARHLGLCDAHYARWRSGVDRRATTPARPCVIAGCSRNAIARGYCQPHYAKRWRLGVL